MTTPNPKRQVQVQIDVPQDLEPTYSNLAMISHSPSEIFIDLACLMPNLPKAKVHTRIVMTPMNAKLLQRALAENLQKFEAQFGEIKTSDDGFSSHNSAGNLKGGNGAVGL